MPLALWLQQIGFSLWLKMIAFLELTNVNSADFDDAIAIYAGSIPAEERQSLNVIEKRVANKKERMFTGRLCKEIVLVALMYPLAGTRFILLDYLAVKEGYRNKGFGSTFVKNIFRLSQEKNKTFIIEVDDPRAGDDLEIRKRRVAFYRRNGAKEMKDVKYVLPPFQNSLSTQMVIMLISSNAETCLQGKIVKELFIQIYKELYSRGENDSFLKSFLDLVPQTIEVV